MYLIRANRFVCKVVAMVLRWSQDVDIFKNIFSIYKEVPEHQYCFQEHVSCVAMFSQVWSEMEEACIFTFYKTAGQRMDIRLFPLHRTHLFYNMS